MLLWVVQRVLISFFFFPSKHLLFLSACADRRHPLSFPAVLSPTGFRFRNEAPAIVGNFPFCTLTPRRTTLWSRFLCCVLVMFFPGLRSPCDCVDTSPLFLPQTFVELREPCPSLFLSFFFARYFCRYLTFLVGPVLPSPFFSISPPLFAAAVIVQPDRSGPLSLSFPSLFPTSRPRVFFQLFPLVYLYDEFPVFILSPFTLTASWGF